MKRTRKAMWRSGLALMLVFSMMLGLCGTAFATDVASDETIQYVSLGDSMTNGYGLAGYEYEYHAGGASITECTDVNCPEEHVVFHWSNGYDQYAPESYPVQVANHFDWDLTQLGMSAMRVEDLHWILELDYESEEAINVATGAWNEVAWNETFGVGDYFTWDEFATGRLDNVYPGSTVGAVAERYQTEVANADVISVGIGNGNFGVFMLGRILEAIGFDGQPSDTEWYKLENAIQECDPEVQEQILTLRDELYVLLEQAMTDSGMTAAEDALPEGGLDAMINTMVYVSVSYVLNYAGVLEAIMQLNPDAEVILVGIMNTLAGMDMTYVDENGVKYVIPMSNVLGVIVEPVNAYIAALPTIMQLAGNSVYADGTFYYAEAPEVECMVDTYADALAEGNTTVRDRFITEIVGECDHDVTCTDLAACDDWSEGMVWGMVGDMFNRMVADYGLKLVRINRTDVEAYESEAQDDPNKVLSAAVYLAFEEAVIASSRDAEISVESFVALADLSGVFGGVAEQLSTLPADVEAAVTKAGSAEVAEWAAINAGQIEGITDGTVPAQIAFACAVAAPALNTACDMTDIEEVQAILTNYFTTKYMLSCMASEIEVQLPAALTADPTLMGLFHLFGRMLIGNGLGAHPSAVGHDELTTAIVTSYENGYTASDAITDKAQAAIDAAYGLIVEYYDDALLYAYNYAEENGYIDAAEAALAELQAELEVLKAELTAQAEVLSAEAKAAIEAEIAKIEAAIAEIEAIIAEAQNITEETYAQVLTLLGQIDASINEMLTLLGEAGTEISAELLAALVNSCNEIWNAYEAAKEQLKSVIPEILEIAAEYLKDVLGDAYDALIEVMSDLAEEYGPKAVEAVYNYLLNNPEQVIAFVQEYGDDAVAFVKTYQNEILGALVFIATTYGEDIAEYIKNNPEEVLETLAYLVEEYGDEAWALIVVYADALGITDALQEVVADLNAQVDELNAEYAKLLVTLEEKLAEIEAQIAEIEKQIAAEKEKLEDCAASVKAEIEAKIEELEAMKAELEAKIEALKAYIAEVENAIAEAIVALNELADAIENVIDVIESGAIQEGIEEALNNLQAAIDAVGDAIVFAQNAADEINEVIAAIRAIDWEAVDAEIKAQIEAAAAQLEAYYQQVLAMIDQAESEFNAALYAATHAQYCICEEQCYVALGGNTGYAAALAEALEIELGADLTNAELNAGTLVDYVTGNAAEIAQATVITYNLEASSFVYDLFNAMLSNSDVDWSAYLDEDGLELSEELKAVLMEQLAAEYGEDAVSAIAPLAENLVYAFVEYAVETVKALGAVEQINEDALMLVVGMNNPLAGMTVTYGGQTVALGDMFEYLIDATNLYYTVYAMVTGSVVFVDASEAEINGTVTNVDLDNLDFYMLLQLDDSMKTSDAGNAYIAEQIENALILGTYELTETKAATCAEAGYEVYTCTVCGYSYTDPLEKTDAHIWGEWTETKEPTATENGEKTRTCTVCGKTETEVIPAIGECEHEYDECTDGKDATCTEDGYKEYTCEKCGDTYTEAIEATGHDYTAVVTNPTCIKQGYTTYTCACGDSYVGDYTAETGHAGDCFCTNCGLHICDGGENCPSKAFSDLNPGSWYHEDTDYVIVTGLMNGMGNGKFKPDGETTRAMLVTTLYRLEGEPDYSTGNVYSDVANNKWYTDAILWATENNIVEGYGNGKFGPNDAITREQIATIFYRYAAFKGLATNQREDLSSYPDDEEISAWAQDAMEWCVAVGMIEGTVEHGVTYLAPEDATLRVQLTTLLHRWQTEIMG